MNNNSAEGHLSVFPNVSVIAMCKVLPCKGNTTIRISVDL